MTNNLISLRRVNFAVIGLMLSFLFVLPILAQPTRPLPLSYERRMESAHGNLKTLEQLNSQIESDKSNVSLYKKRLHIYAFLRENYFDNVDKWKFYDVNYGADLSHIIELEPTALNYFNRGQWSFLNFSLSATYHPPPKEISELYPHNIYIDNASVDLLKAVELTSDRNTLSEIYGLLGFMYMERPRVLSSAPNFSKWKDKIPFELVRQDLELSIKYRQLALKVELMRQDAKNLQAGFSSIYLAAAEIAEKLGDSVAGRKFTQAAQKYRK